MLQKSLSKILAYTSYHTHGPEYLHNVNWTELHVMNHEFGLFQIVHQGDFKFVTFINISLIRGILITPLLGPQ